MSTEEEVRRASEQFYEALNSLVNGDAGPMADIWSQSPTVTTMHPIGGMEVGWAEVSKTWEQVSKAFSGGQVELSDQIIQAAGDMAYEVGNEHGQASLGGERVSFEQRVTNIYRREDGAWKLVHHHTDISPGMLEVMGHLQSAECGMMSAE